MMIYEFVIVFLILYCTKIYWYIGITKITLFASHFTIVFELFLLREKHKKRNLSWIGTCVVSVAFVQNWSIGDFNWSTIHSRSNGGRTMNFFTWNVTKC